MDLTYEACKNKFNVLAVDDNIDALNLLVETLDSPLLNIKTATSLESARILILNNSYKWCCWIIDIDLGKDSSGLSLLEEFNFQFCIILSGLKNMQMASEATKKGALYVFDKNPSIILTEFRNIVYRIVVLGFILGGKRTNFINVFLELQKKTQINPTEWAYNTYICLRHLQNICTLHTGLSPRLLITFYYFLCCLMYAQINKEGKIELKEENWTPFFDQNLYSFLKKCIEEHTYKFQKTYYQLTLHHKGL